MGYDKILYYDLFIFDFDGTLMDTEKYHYQAWLSAISFYLKKEIIFTIQDYEKYLHSIEKNSNKNFLKYRFDITDYDALYKIKQENYTKLINTNKDILSLLPGAENFINFLKENNKKIVIVSNTRADFINFYLEHFPILKKIDEIYTKEHFMQIKPNPECYLKIAHKYKDLKKIGFEDSYIGYHALYQVSSITPIFIKRDNYYYQDFICTNYKGTLLFDYNNLENLNNYVLKIILHNLEQNLALDYQPKIQNNSESFQINQIIKNNIRELQNNSNAMNYIINNISIILKNMDPTNHIYLTGMGKSGYICKKCASTWQSLEINASYIDLPNLPHGDFGIFRENDTLIIISNSGDTEEILYILKYLKQNFNKKVKTISIVANQNPQLEQFSDFTFKLNEIREADNINMTPSTSSMIFMTLLDSIAIYLKQNITKEEFKICHPSGSLGKR